MGIYYYAADDSRKEIILPPRGYSNKIPEIFNPESPFPGMIMMKNCYGNKFDVHNDMEACYEYQCMYKDITQEVYDEYTGKFKTKKIKGNQYE